MTLTVPVQRKVCSCKSNVAVACDVHDRFHTCQCSCTGVPAPFSHLQLCKLCLILRYAQSPRSLELALAVLLHRTADRAGKAASSNYSLSKALLTALTEEISRLESWA